MKKTAFIVPILCAFILFSKTPKSQDIIDASTLDHKIMAGYQGWFVANGDESGYGWNHWSGSGATPYYRM